MNTPLPYLQLIQHFSEYIQPRDSGLIAYCHQAKKPSLRLEWLLLQSA
ncbi:hypothetical protein [Geminocystis sp. NIES-3709]|nr:hypothetical protein [Geminocystis sp. NIES-3709]BAQ63564.1 hypothetical protein GM3709_329 [Geminocystis sp. NIES-3709]